MSDPTPPKITCQCGRALVYYSPGQCWVCPEVLSTALVGLIAPKESPYVRRALSGRWTELAEHITCLPAELFDEDLGITPAIEYTRTGKLPTPQAGGRNADGSRVVVDKRGVPVRHGPGSRESLDTYQCEDCGFRTPSPNSMTEHLGRAGHSYAEAPSGKRIHRSPQWGGVLR